ncbi:MAG: hypothetical protein ACUVWP_03405 [bacterium]
MKKAAIMLLGIALILSFTGCAKKPAEVILGTWTGKMTSEGAEPSNITMVFEKDGSFTLTPEGEEAAKGTYKVDEKGALTGDFVVEGQEITGKMTGTLDVKKLTIKGDIEMKVMVEVAPPPEPEPKPGEVKKEEPKVKPEAGKEEPTPAPVKEEKIVKATFEVTKGEAKKEETTEGGK